MRLVSHLDELRARIVVSLAVFGVALALCFWQNHLLLEIAAGPLPSDHGKLLTLGVTEPFTTTMTVSTYGAIVLAMPVLLSRPTPSCCRRSATSRGARSCRSCR